ELDCTRCSTCKRVPCIIPILTFRCSTCKRVPLCSYFTMAFDWSTVAGPSHIPLTPPSQERTLFQIIGYVPFLSTSHGGHHLAPQLFLLLHSAIMVHVALIEALGLLLLEKVLQKHTTYQHRRRHIANSPTRPSPHLTPGLLTIFQNLNMESDNDDDPIPLFPSHHPQMWSILDIDSAHMSDIGCWRITMVPRKSAKIVTERFLIYVVVNKLAWKKVLKITDKLKKERLDI
ncbi:hypothetical protein F5879DRAFT_1053451, partial [Lentinula edodes]